MSAAKKRKPLEKARNRAAMKRKLLIGEVGLEEVQRQDAGKSQR
jgi:hypothetical protein